jgi:hypothetical protein
MSLSLSFWLAETLKYLYLLFADQNTLRLDQWVLNTEVSGSLQRNPVKRHDSIDLF